MHFKIGVVAVFSAVLFLSSAQGQSVNVAARTDQNLLVCSWNIKWFKDTGRDLTKIAKVLAKFDLCGIIELQSDKVLEELQIVLQQETGETWMYIQSNRTGHSNQYIEQFAFIWRMPKSGLQAAMSATLPTCNDSSGISRILQAFARATLISDSSLSIPAGHLRQTAKRR